MDWLTEPFQYPFMQTALVASVLVGVSCAGLGAYVVLRRMAFIGDAMAHTVLPGLVIAHLNGWNLSVGALLAGGLTAVGIGWLSKRDAVREDAAIGILFTGMFALGVTLMSSGRGFRDLSQILFGNILGVSLADVALIGGVAVIVVLALAVFHKELELTSYDPTYAESIGLHPDTVRYGLLFLLAFAIVMAIQAVGVLLTSALLITPAAAAGLLTNRLPRLMLIAAGITVIASIVGLYASYYWRVSSGGAIVMACTLCFGVAWLTRPRRARRTIHMPTH